MKREHMKKLVRAKICFVADSMKYKLSRPQTETEREWEDLVINVYNFLCFLLQKLEEETDE